MLVANDTPRGIHRIGGYDCLQRQLEQQAARITELKAVKNILLAAWKDADEYGPVDDGSPAARAAKQMQERFREAVEAAQGG